MSSANSDNHEQAPAESAPETNPSRPLTLAIPTTTAGTLQPRNYGEAIEVAKMFAYSGMVPKQFYHNVGAVLVAMQMGSELGLSPMSSLQSIAVINGHPSVWGDAMLALVMRHPDFIDIAETEGESFAKCIVKRRGRSPTQCIFSVDDAKKAKLWGKEGVWQQYPRRMLQLRARGFALRDSFPDALRGIISVEEARDSSTTVDAIPEFINAADIPEGTMKLGKKPESAKDEPPPLVVQEPLHNPETGEVIAASPLSEPLPPQAPPPAENNHPDCLTSAEREWRQKHAAKRGKAEPGANG